MSAAELFREGKLNEAVEAAIAAVKQKPTDLDARYTLAQMLCFAGDLERADTHLDAIASQDKDRLIVIGMLRHLTRAEQWRRQFFDEGRVPEVIAEPSPVVRLHLEAALSTRKGDTTQAAELIRQAQEQQTPVAGTCDGRAFADVRDLDDLLGPVCEVLTSNGKYFWIPWERIERIEMRPVETPFDLLWRPTHMEVRGGPDGEVFIPVLYANSHKEPDNALRLGRGTDWRGEEQALVRGIGQRMLLVGEEDKSLLDIGTIEFADA
ncbi:MAG: SciE type virulence protein [Planctomycetota bacterium]|nr:MAG: SciE type virulence protein [Planctomycetota bacterium]